MKTLIRWLAVSLVTAFAATASLAQPRFSQAELDQALAPVALYPDSLLSQLLMAATYPEEVAQAALWSRSNPQLKGEEAVRRIENEPWDPSVKSLVAFPQVLAMMGDRPDWVRRLGEMFQGAPELVSDTVQELRRRADEAGNLRSGDEMKVYRDDRYYYIEPASPEVVYVPYYDPRVVYGRWWWPSYEPIWWRPWAGYTWYPGWSGFGWGYGISLGSGFFYSGWDWPGRYIYFRDRWPRYYRGWDYRHGHRWWHDSRDRRNWSDRHDGRWDGRRRDGDRDGRWDGRHRDGDRDGRWDGRRDGDRDGRRDGDRDGRRDGDRDGRRDADRDGRRDADRDGRGRDGDRDGRGRDRRGARDGASAPVVAVPAERNPVYRSAAEAPRYAPRVNGAAAVGRGYGHAPAPDRPQIAPPANPVARHAPARAPARVERPVGRSAPASAPSAPSHSGERHGGGHGGGRGNGERSRER